LTTNIIHTKAYSLGKLVAGIGAGCSNVGSEVKTLSLSAPFSPEEYAFLLPEAERYAQHYGVHLFLEKHFLQTDLFPTLQLHGNWVFLIYKKETVLNRYLSLKTEKVALLEKDQYSDEARIGLATKMGRLLSYSEGNIKERLHLRYPYR
jgi:hypothetical protein